ncbi:MAG: GYF domain-containing protein [Puniceicoccales bacterium]|jgi:hypothetical protein|nr:GYF domain-containing protein [Puniceicoccales bacterium]
MMREWYYSENGQMYGPLPEDQIQTMIWERQLTEDTLVWCGEPDFVERGWVRIADTELSSQIPTNNDSSLNESPPISNNPHYKKMENAQTSTNYVFSSNRQFSNEHRGHQFSSRHVEEKVIKGAIAICIALMIATVVGVSFLYIQQQANAKIMPHSAKELEGKNYQDVITRLKTAGFTNVKTEIVDDLVIGWLTKDGEVESVSVNGKTNFNSGSKFPIDAKIVVTYHTFPAKYNTGKQTSAATPGRTDETARNRTVSGFNKETNRSLSFYGIDFSFPAYFDVLGNDSTDTKKHYYPEKLEYYATLLFFCEDLTVSQESFNAQKSVVVSNIMERIGDDAKIQKSESATIAGMSGWTLTCKTTGSTLNYSFAYNVSKGKLIFVYLVYDDKDKSNYDYLGDYAKILKTAILSPTLQPATVENNRIEFKNGDVYVGELDRGLINGQGTLTFKNIGKYVGSFNQGVREGSGIFTWNSGEIYQGEWQADKISGEGRLTISDTIGISGKFSDTRLIQGKYVNTIKGTKYDVAIDSPSNISNITITFANGVRYEGTYSTQDNAFTGNGTITYPNGDTYKGDIVNGRKEGTGAYTWESGAVYSGEWKNDKMNGRGTYFYLGTNDPVKLRGSFANNVPNGSLEYVDAKKNVFVTTWKNGKCTKVGRK